ncbi:MAG: TRAP transporter substrate-binding protein [Proteobacteria bacterium]|nr:TRAP transporter substrate-binding protein [Pseudomonadota bacterium]
MGRKLTGTLVGGLLGLWLAALPAAAEDLHGFKQIEKLRAMAADLPPMHLRVLGYPKNASAWVTLQQPFWNDVVPAASGGRITVALTSMTELGLKGPEVFRLVKAGISDVVDLVANYAAGEVPEMDGLDLPGVAPDLDTAVKVIDAYESVLGRILSSKIGVQPLGFGPSLAQVFWCNAPINRIEDLKGKKVRGSSAAIADLVDGLGAIPVTMAFDEVPAALQRGVIDCAVTGTVSGNIAKLFEVTTHLYAASAGWAPWSRAANKAVWNRLDPKVRQWLQYASDPVFKQREIEVAAEATNQGIWCSTGDGRCTWGEAQRVTKAKMKLVPVSDHDRKVLGEAVEKAVLPRYAKACGAECAKTWSETAGKAVGLTARTPN